MLEFKVEIDLLDLVVGLGEFGDNSGQFESVAVLFKLFFTGELLHVVIRCLGDLLGRALQHHVSDKESVGFLLREPKTGDGGENSHGDQEERLN